MNIKVDINAFRRGELTLRELSERLTTLVRADPTITQDVITQLDDSYRAKEVQLDVFMGLVEQVRASTTSKQWTAATTTGTDETASDPSLVTSLHLDTGSTYTQMPTDATALNADGPMVSGTVIKGRFVVERVLGIGGMGTVYKVRDRVREEAKDRYPHVALKVLNADFKQHAKAFIALQRECSRTQRLAHPNIATVYDFDRSDGMVFMTMELLEGTPLDMFIKRVMPKGGLSFEEALPLIEGMGKALAYAHEHSIVHADFKPGNAFVTKSGTVKVLDFGIARATKEPGQGGQTTLFDGAELGALTPAYASPEMHDGLEPDPRDDVFALACVAYELLTGRHPFNKQAANTARARKLEVEPIKGLTRSQMQGLARGLAFEREERSADVETFLADLNIVESQTGPWIWLAAGLAAVGIAAGAGWYFMGGDDAPALAAPEPQRPAPQVVTAPEVTEPPPAPGPDVAKQQAKAALQALGQRLQRSLQTLTSIGQFDIWRDEFQRFEQAAPEAELLTQAKRQLGTLLKQKVAGQITAQEFEQAYASLARYQEFVTADLHADLRLQVNNAEQAYQLALAEKERETRKLARQAAEREAQEQAEAERQAREQAKREAQQLAAQKQKDLEQARLRLEQERVALGREKRRLAEQKAAKQKAAVAARKRAEQQARQQETAQVDETEALKGAFLAHARALRTKDADAVSRQLRSRLSSADSFLVQTVPQSMAKAYLEKAHQEFGMERLDDAVRDVEKGLEYAPRSKDLLETLSHYGAIQTAEWELNSLRSRQKFGDYKPLAKALQVLKQKDVNRYQDLSARLYSQLEARIRSLQESQPDLARDWLSSAQRAMPDYQPIQDLKVLEPVHMAIVVHAVPDPETALTLEQYSRRMGEALAKQLGIIMKDGKLLARLITDEQTSQALHNESSGHEANKSVCSTQGVGQVLAARFLPQASTYGSEPNFDQADFNIEVYDCRRNSKAGKSFSVNTNRKDQFAYELAVRQALVQFSNQYSFIQSY